MCKPGILAAMELLATNLPGQLRMLDVIRRALKTAENVAISVSFLRFSGLQLLVDDLKRFTARGGRVRLLTSTYLGITQPEALRVLATIKGAEVRVHLAKNPLQGFHPKFFVFQGAQTECWVGSSNISKGGLTSNVEANLRHDSEQALEEALSAFEMIWEHPDVWRLSDELTDQYALALLQSATQRMAVSQVLVPVPRVRVQPNSAQAEALVNLARLRELGETRAVVIAAPGVGKTFLAAFDAEAAGAERVLFLSHRLEHLTQAKKTFEQVFGTRRTTGLVYGELKQTQAEFVFGTVQSANALESTAFDYVVVDEFHHAAAPTYRALLSKIKPQFLLGLTATPERQDGHDVLSLCDFNIAYEARLIEAINRSWLVPFHYFGIADETVDYSESIWRSSRLNLEQVETALMLETRVAHILEHALEKGFDGARRACVGFCAGRRHAKFMSEKLNERGLCATYLTGENSLEEREETYANLENPEHALEWLFVADLLNEGVDIPGINSLLFLRPTDSATIFIQQLGRGLRLSPDCEVLTVLDFVGHHRNAWLNMEVLSDAGAAPNTSTLPEFDLTPPKHCEILLDDLTREVLLKVRRFTRRKSDWCEETYRNLRDEKGTPPFPVDLIGRADAPSLGDFRAVYGSWLDCRKAFHDAEPWEMALEKDHLGWELLAQCEKNWQQPRVYAYALLWGLCAAPKTPLQGYEEFFERYPRWMAEYAAAESTNAWQTLEKKLGGLLDGKALKAEVLEQIPGSALLEHVELRLQYTLEADFRLRHGGVLRTPSELVVHRAYTRQEIVNHFRQQYDPALHNAGVITFEVGAESHIVMITKLDTSGAKSEFHYVNQFDGPQRFLWQSQNRQTQENRSGRAILDHKEDGASLHLFVQTKSHSSPHYLGKVDVESVEGNAPMNVTFSLRHRLTDELCELWLEGVRK